MHVFQPYFGKSIRVFIDDFCIYSSKLLHLEKEDEGLTRHVGERKVALLGHVVSEKGIEVDSGEDSSNFSTTLSYHY